MDLTPEQIEVIATQVVAKLNADLESDRASSAFVEKTRGPILEMVFEAVFARLDNEEMIEHVAARALQRLNELGVFGNPGDGQSRWLRLVIELEEPNITRAGFEQWGERVASGEDWQGLENATAMFLPRSVSWHCEEYQGPES